MPELLVQTIEHKQSYCYESKEERDRHIVVMKSLAWELDGYNSKQAIFIKKETLYDCYLLYRSDSNEEKESS